MAAALTLAEPGALRLPGLQKGSEKQRKKTSNPGGGRKNVWAVGTTRKKRELRSRTQKNLAAGGSG